MDSLWVLVLLGLKTSLWALLKNISHNFMTKENRENIQKINNENNPPESRSRSCCLFLFLSLVLQLPVVVMSSQF